MGYGSGSMPGLVDLHLGYNGAAFLVVMRKALEMPTQMGFYLALGFREKTQIPFIAKHAGKRAYGE